MSKRGKRRNSKRRKSSSSSKQSVSQYIFQKQNKSNSVSYKDEIVEKGETDSFRKENALSESEDEDKYNSASPKEKRFKQDYQVNLFPNQRNIYTTTTKDKEKGVRIITSVSVDDMDDSAPKFMFQQLQEPLYSNPTNPSTPVANIMKINCSGSQVKLEIQEISQRNSSGLKTTFVLFNEKGDGAETVFKSKCERTWIPNNDQPFQHVSAQNYSFTFSSTTEQMETQTDSHSVSPVTTWGKDPKADFLASGHPADPQLNLKPQGKRKYFHKSFSSDQFWDIPPPQEFADLRYNTLEDLTDDLASCRINDCGSREKQKLMLQQTPDITYNDDSGYPFSLEVTERQYLTPSFDQMSESDNYEPMFMRPSVSTNRSSFTKDFINCHKRKSWIRNNSIATVEHKACFLPKKRRQTFPGPSEGLLPEDFLLPYGESFSSLTMCSHVLQTGKRQQGDDRSPLMGRSNSYQGKGDKDDHVVTINRQYRRQSSIRYRCIDPRRQDWEPFVYKDRESLDTDDCGDKEDPAEIADSGFDQDIGEVDYHGSETLTDQLSLRALSIKVIPPSCCGSEEQMLQSHLGLFQNGKTEDASQEESTSVHQEPSNPSDVEPEPRSLQTDSGSLPGSCSEKTLNVDPDPGGAHLKDPDVHSLNTEDSCPSKLGPGKSMDSTTLSSQMSEDTNPEMSSTDDSHKTIVTTCSDTKLYKHDKQSLSRSFFESKELLKPLGHKDLDNGGSDHWAKRRKLFKESKQWSSTAEGSITSDITEESVSEDTPTIDMSVQDSEERGFYTETFHSAAWIYQGDNVSSGSTPPSLNSRNRAISIRERTVKISKGAGEYPWGFRIQFSKPIVVTEVDTNGAAEEAGLMVGDYVLAVNGTDVTSIPHSEAADLARQGPDILTLTIGSDIARGPNTPRPGCRGYLHKRTQSGLIKGWRKRWFVLTHDCCLSYYRHQAG
ncbi:uncharacterized protein pdzph1 [Sphaeramia orbicularis]|uniref:uncharacterized protein pdzph1 n=1 Tax=Sphaeramia orbicularis TaxID=375764 RepID=UPI00117EA588|nr:uncharacterized protein LOC115429551 [Sphaeramia orbicularis]